MRALLPSVAVLALLGSGCVAPGAQVPEDEPTGGLQAPTFTPLDAGTTTDAASATPSTNPSSPAPRASATPTDAATATPTPSTTTTASGTAASSPTPRPPVRGTLTDGTGDLEGLNRSNAPGYADLRAVRLEMAGDRGTIRVDFAAPAPEAGEGDEIVNVATYHDVTGDGNVDYEIWASLTSDGWGTSWYDLRNGTARFAADDDVDVEIEDGTLVLTFPASHLDGARSGQWLASSEWGTSLAMSAGTTVTDDAPDDRSGRRWPN